MIGTMTPRDVAVEVIALGTVVAILAPPEDMHRCITQVRAHAEIGYHLMGIDWDSEVEPRIDALMLDVTRRMVEGETAEEIIGLIAITAAALKEGD